MNSRIYLKDWLKFKPYLNQVTTDLYYLKICNKVKDEIETSAIRIAFSDFITESEINNLCCILTSYFEDIISGTNIWNSFVRRHKLLYNKPHPFYETDDNIENEINTVDVAFLIWYFLNTVQNERTIIPENKWFIKLAESIMEIFEELWLTAPENEDLLNAYHIHANETNYYTVRAVIDKLIFTNYLFFTDIHPKIQTQLKEVYAKKGLNDQTTLALINESRDFLLNTYHSKLLSLNSKEWAAEIIGQQHQVSQDILQISPKIRSYFFYKSQDENYIYIEHIATGKKFNLLKSSFDHSKTLTKTDTIIFIGLVQWRGQWWFSGMSILSEISNSIIEEEKNSVDSKMALAFLNPNKEKIEALIDKQLKQFKLYNNGAQIAFMPAQKVKSFVSAYQDLVNTNSVDSQKHSETDQEGNAFSQITDEHKSALVFFNPKAGLEVHFGICSAFPMPENSFFREEECIDDFQYLLDSKECSKELVEFCMKRCKSNLHFLNEQKYQYLLRDLDFLTRFYKEEKYHSHTRLIYAD